MTKKQALTVIGAPLSNTSKMPCKSFGLPTRACAVGTSLMKNPNSTCHFCYANKGFYTLFPEVKASQERRLASLCHPDWVDAMVALIGKDQWFRWHDSGDLQDVQHLERIVAVCLKTPECRHWMPTREFGIVRQYLEKGGQIPANLTIRLSAYMVDGAPPRPNGLTHLTTSTVHHSKDPVGLRCNAPQQDGHCLDCRACWDKSVPNVSYHQH